MIGRHGDLEYGDKYTYMSIPLVDRDRHWFCSGKRRVMQDRKTALNFGWNF
jgi:hypothetical protein